MVPTILMANASWLVVINGYEPTGLVLLGLALDLNMFRMPASPMASGNCAGKLALKWISWFLLIVILTEDIDVIILTQINYWIIVKPWLIISHHYQTSSLRGFKWLLCETLKLCQPRTRYSRSFVLSGGSWQTHWKMLKVFLATTWWTLPDSLVEMGICWWNTSFTSR